MPSSAIWSPYGNTLTNLSCFSVCVTWAELTCYLLQVYLKQTLYWKEQSKAGLQSVFDTIPTRKISHRNQSPFVWLHSRLDQVPHLYGIGKLSLGIISTWSLNCSIFRGRNPFAFHFENVAFEVRICLSLALKLAKIFHEFHYARVVWIQVRKTTSGTELSHSSNIFHTTKPGFANVISARR